MRAGCTALAAAAGLERVLPQTVHFVAEAFSRVPQVGHILVALGSALIVSLSSDPGLPPVKWHYTIEKIGKFRGKNDKKNRKWGQ